MSKLTVVNEKLEVKEIDLLLVFRLEDSSREYILYSIDNEDTSNIFVSGLNMDEQGYSELTKIVDENELKKIMKILKRIMKGDVIYE